MPASVEIFTKTHEFFRTNVSSLVTLMLSLAGTGTSLPAACCAAASAAISAPNPMPAVAPANTERRV